MVLKAYKNQRFSGIGHVGFAVLQGVLKNFEKIKKKCLKKFKKKSVCDFRLFLLKRHVWITKVMSRVKISMGCCFVFTAWETVLVWGFWKKCKKKQYLLDKSFFSKSGSTRPRSRRLHPTNLFRKLSCRTKSWLSPFSGVLVNYNHTVKISTFSVVLL